MNQSSDEIKFLKLVKFRCENSSLDFTRYFFRHRFNKKFVIGEHHKTICDALDRVMKGECKRLIINIAPRYGKTELAVKNFIAQGLAINPSSRFIHLSYSDDLALDNSEEVKDIVKSEEYQRLFPNVKIKQGSDSKKKWYTSENGGVYATSTKGQVTGFGAGRVDDEFDPDFIPESNVFSGALIIDDPIKPEDADSDTIRDRINERFDSTIKNRVNSRNTPIIIIMQRLHEQDLCGYLIDRNASEWEVLRLPCIKEGGTALWEFKHTLEELDQMRADNETVFERQYQQNPMPTKGVLFPKSELRHFKPSEALTKSFVSSIGYADIADEGTDYTSCPIGRNIGQDIYITNVLFNNANSDVTIPLMANKLKSENANYVRVESNSMGAMYGRTLQKELSVCRVLSATATVNKHTRILMDAGFIKKYCVFLAPEHQDAQYQAFMKQLNGYLQGGGAKHDDAPDSLSGLVAFIRAMMPHIYA